jgi:hypothetical protein
MPAHSSHFLQPLYIGCFAVLKRSYGNFIDQKMRPSINHIDKLKFLATYPLATAEALSIQNSFEAAGLVPVDPDRVLSKLNIHLRTPTPTSRPNSRLSEFGVKYLQIFMSFNSKHHRSKLSHNDAQKALRRRCKLC